MNNLGTLYQKLGNLKKGEEFYLKSLQICTKIFGENHSYVKTLMYNLAVLYGNMKNKAKANEFYMKYSKINQNLASQN